MNNGVLGVVGDYHSANNNNNNNNSMLMQSHHHHMDGSSIRHDSTTMYQVSCNIFLNFTKLHLFIHSIAYE